jgi:hypothetical protein
LHCSILFFFYKKLALGDVSVDPYGQRVLYCSLYGTEFTYQYFRSTRNPLSVRFTTQITSDSWLQYIDDHRLVRRVDITSMYMVYIVHQLLRMDISVLYLSSENDWPRFMLLYFRTG